MGPKTCVGFLIINTALVNNKLLTNNRFPAFHQLVTFLHPNDVFLNVTWLIFIVLDFYHLWNKVFLSAQNFCWTRENHVFAPQRLTDMEIFVCPNSSRVYTPVNHVNLHLKRISWTQQYQNSMWRLTARCTVFIFGNSVKSNIGCYPSYDTSFRRYSTN